MKTRVMVETSLLVAMAVVLDYVAGIYSQAFWPYGGSVSFVLVPLAVLAYRHGVVMGVLGGAMVGVIQLLMGAYIIHPVQVLLDYPLPFAMLGLCGLFATKMKDSSKQTLTIIISVVVASTMRLVMHVLSGAIFFAEYAGDMNPWWYSIGYNAPFVILSGVISAIVLIVLYKRYGKELVK